MSTAVKHMTRPERFEVTPVPHSRIRQLHKQFPPREGELWWPHTAASAEEVEARLNCSASCGVVMIAISRMPASISTDSG